VQGIKIAQVHLFYTDFLVHGTGANFALKGESVKVMAVMNPSPVVGDPCADKFVPMQ